MREDGLLTAINAFFADRVFGPERRALLAAEMGDADRRAEQSHRDAEEALRHGVADVERRLERLMRTLEDNDDPDGLVFNRVRQRLGELEASQAKLAALAALEAEPPTSSGDPWLSMPSVLAVDLLDAPHDHLRALFEAFRLVVRYDRRAHHATIQVTIVEDAMDHLSAAALPVAADTDHRREPGKHPVASVSLLGSAPGRNRTCDTRFRKPVLYPLSYGGGIGPACSRALTQATKLFDRAHRTPPLGAPTPQRHPGAARSP